MRKVYYQELVPLDTAFQNVIQTGLIDEEAPVRLLLLYTLHKGGLLEDGMHAIQFDAIFDAFCEASLLLSQELERIK